MSIGPEQLMVIRPFGFDPEREGGALQKGPALLTIRRQSLGGGDCRGVCKSPSPRPGDGGREKKKHQYIPRVQGEGASKPLEVGGSGFHIV